MTEEEKQLLSIYYMLIDLLPDNVTVMLEYPSENLTLPTVSIIEVDKVAIPFELGSKEMNKRSWRVEVFAENRSQRDYLAYIISEELKNNISVFDYDEGFPPSITPTKIGRLITSRIKVIPIHVFKDLVSKLYWRKIINFNSIYENY